MEKEKNPEMEDAQNQVVNDVAVQRLKYEEELNNLFDELEKGGYYKRTYGKGSRVEMDGTLFGSLINFINDHKRSLYTIQQMLNLLATTSDAMLTDNASVTIELMKVHKENVDAGNSISMEDMDKEDAKEKIKVVTPKGKATKKGKATGSKEK